MATKKGPVKSSKKALPTSESTRDRFIRVTTQIIDAYGESAVKLEDVLVEADASVSSLYHHFGSLRGLIEETQIHRFMMARFLDVDQLRLGAERVTTKREFGKLLNSVVSGMLSETRAFNRMRRVTALASSESSESMRAKLRELERETLDSVTNGFMVAQARGVIPKSVDVQAATLWASTLVFSRVLTELLEDETLQDRWDEMTHKFILQAFGL